MENFEGFGLSQTLNDSLTQMEYSTPTPIQAQAIPLALEGRDVLGSAQTGTGKTAAFSIPMIEAMLADSSRGALVLTPTRELAKQVLGVIHQLLGRNSGINTAFIIGGEPMRKQFDQLKRDPQIIVGTPGRINDHLRRGTVKLGRTDFLVLDETDRMLDMGFGVQLDEIFKFLPQQRQTLMFSATLPQEIIQMSGKYLVNPERISMGATNVVAKNIKQETIRIDQAAKYNELNAQLHERDGTVIVFVKTKRSADKISKRLRQDGFTSDTLHGDLRQSKRDKVMRNYRNKNFRILVATDIAARGLDVPHIEHVINYDLPQVAEDYIHRMGRTARAGAEGSALCFISPQDGRNWRQIEELLDPSLAANRNTNKNGKKRKAGARGNKKFIKSRKKPWEVRGDKREGGNNNGGGKSHRGNRSEGGYNDRNDNRSDRPSGEGKKSYGKKPYGKKSYGEKSGGNKSDGNGYQGNRSNGGNSKPFAKKWDKKRSEGSDGNRSDNRGGNRNEGRSDNRNEGRSDNRKPARSNWRSEGRPNRGDNRNDNRGNDRGNNKSYAKKSDANGNSRSGKPTHNQNKPSTPTGNGEGGYKGGNKRFGNKPGNKFGAKSSNGYRGKPSNAKGGKSNGYRGKSSNASGGKSHSRPNRNNNAA